ncbi:hypothetical protein BC829DRAFT_126915 [Chytridium lagenaria]|nr:hypothetical protein BC829DRAFT_126915 [Chytridium lagenaria]
MSTMPRPPVDYKDSTWMPSTMAGQGQGQGGGYTNVLSPRKSFTLGPNITDRAIVEAIENGSHSGEIPAMTTTRGPNNAHRPTTREDSNARYSLRDSGGANSMPNAVREESSLRRRSIEDASKIAQGRSRTSTMSQVPGNGGGGGAPMTVQEGEIDWDVYRNMAIVVCGPTMMNIAVGDLLRDMNYPADVIYTL